MFAQRRWVVFLRTKHISTLILFSESHYSKTLIFYSKHKLRWCWNAFYNKSPPYNNNTKYVTLNFKFRWISPPPPNLPGSALSFAFKRNAVAKCFLPLSFSRLKLAATANLTTDQTLLRQNNAPSFLGVFRQRKGLHFYETKNNV